MLKFPLERDEGEYAYAGQLILQGIPPYKLAYNMKMPGTYVAYAGIMSVFGQTVSGIHLGLIVVNVATLALLFLLARRFCGFFGGAVATAAYALMSLDTSLLGQAAHATHFVVLPALAGFLLLQRPGEARRIWICVAAGLCFGIAVMMKQQGVFLGIFGGLYLNYLELQKSPIPKGQIVQRMIGYALGCVVPFLLVCLWLSIAGVFPAFWHWTIEYAREYTSILPLDAGLANLKFQLVTMFQAAPLLWAAGIIGIVVAIASKAAAGKRFFLFGFLLAAFLTTVPGFYFRNHYFIPFLPALAIFIGLAAQWLGQRMDQLKFGPAGQAFAAVIAAVVCAQSLFFHRDIFFSLTPMEACRQTYSINPFPESLEIAKYIEEHSSPTDTIAVFGSEPQIYFYSHRHSATGYIYAYPLVEDQPYASRMQEDMIHQLEANHPEYIVFVSNTLSWLSTVKSPRQIFSWFDEFQAKHLDLVGVVDTKDNGYSYAWGDAAKSYRSTSGFVVSIYKRRRDDTPTPGTTAPTPAAAAH